MLLTIQENDEDSGKFKIQLYFYYINKSYLQILKMKGFNAKTDQARNEMIIQLRFGTNLLQKQGKTYLTYKSLSEIFRIPASHIARICKRTQISQAPLSIQKLGPQRKLQVRHENYISHETTLEQMKFFSLEQRCSLLRKKFPELSISQSTLRRFYLREGISWKTMKVGKEFTKNELQDLNNKRKTTFREFLRHIDNRRSVIYLDETLFVPFSIKSKSWAHKGKNQTIEKLGCRLNAVAAVVCIQPKKGMVRFVLRERSIKAQEILLLLESMRQDVKSSQITLFCDNLRVHHSHIVKDFIRTCGWKQVFNAAYSPQYHCIEEIFSVVKNEYKRLMLEKGFKISNQAHRKMIIEAFDVIKYNTLLKVEQRHIKQMRELLCS